MPKALSPPTPAAQQALGDKRGQRGAEKSADNSCESKESCCPGMKVPMIIMEKGANQTCPTDDDHRHGHSFLCGDSCYVNEDR